MAIKLVNMTGPVHGMMIKNRKPLGELVNGLSLFTDGCWLMIHPRVLSAAAVTLIAKEERKEE